MTLDGRTVLITGGTGSFGRKFVEIALNEFQPKKVIIFSRDEFKQHEMRVSGLDDKRLRYFIGDVRDRSRLYRALDGVDIVIHAAALKQVPACEYNPIEAVKTNVMGTANLVEAAIDRNVDKVIALSTDKAAAPVNLYGATKLCADKLFIAGNSYAGGQRARLSVVRYGNVVASRGSVIPLFLESCKRGSPFPITDPRMTRFWLTIEQAVRFVLNCLEIMQGGELFVPKIPSMNIIDLAKAIDPNNGVRIIGIRPGEKIHEVLVPEDDARNTLEFDDKYVILPPFRSDLLRHYVESGVGKVCTEGFRYSSDNNSQWLTSEDLRALVQSVIPLIERGN